jgi:hypothetical protein
MVIMKKHKGKLKARPAPEVGSDAYFDQMPARQAREELKITWKNYRRVQRQLADIRGGFIRL